MQAVQLMQMTSINTIISKCPFCYLQMNSTGKYVLIFIQCKETTLGHDQRGTQRYKCTEGRNSRRNDFVFDTSTKMFLYQSCFARQNTLKIEHRIVFERCRNPFSCNNMAKVSVSTQFDSQQREIGQPMVK